MNSFIWPLRTEREPEPAPQKRLLIITKMILVGQQCYSKYQLPERQQALGYQCYDKYNLTYILHKRVCCKKQYTIDNGTAGSVTE
ncbi:MAG: hypothetical protein ACKVOW_04605 [Chitinophagaceae bacterium]